MVLAFLCLVNVLPKVIPTSLKIGHILPVPIAHHKGIRTCTNYSVPNFISPTLSLDTVALTIEVSNVPR